MSDPEHTELQFTVAADGMVRGDDGAGGRLASSLHYACRVAGQLEFIAGLGDLERVTTLGTSTLTVHLAWGLDRGLALEADVAAAEPREHKAFTVVGGADVHAALAHCMQRLRQALGTHWAAVMTADRRLVGAGLPQSGGSLLETMSALPEAGVRALAVLGAIDARYRETAVFLEFERGVLMVAALGEHAVFALADKYDAAVATDLVDEVRAILTPEDVARAESIAQGAAALPTTVQPEPAAAAPAPSGMRFRAVQPRQSRRRR